jgi:transposase
VRLMRSSDKPLARISRELDVSEQTLRNWRKQREIDEGEREGLTTDEKAELARLRRENKVLRQEREILRKATVFFAREDGTR